MLTLKNDEIKKWLRPQSQTSAVNYHHLMLMEQQNERANAIKALKKIVLDAHKDAKDYLRQCIDSDLDPIENNTTLSIIDAYPDQLHLTTKKAYFGEIMAGLIAENYSSLGPRNWKVMTFLFRLHELAFDQLELQRQTGNLPNHVFGQTGDDCVAFSKDASGQIIATLICEGKCTNAHDASMISEAHDKISSSITKPVSLSRIIRILKDQVSDPESVQWVEALLKFYHQDLRTGYRRFDLVSYTCGQRPIQNSTWMPINKPHNKYSGRRVLQSVEVHLNNVDNLVNEVYKK